MNQSHLAITMIAVDVATMSAITFIVYGIDKHAARREARRVPEANLHLLALMGGWPGALVAQRVFRHKTRKQPFRTVFWLTTVANVGAVAALTYALRLAG